MAGVFLSHSDKDKLKADEIDFRLSSHGFEVHIVSGVKSEWEKVIYAALRKSEVVLLCVTANSIQSRWVFSEMNIAQHSRIPIIALLLERVELPPEFDGHEVVDFTRNDEQAYRNLLETLRPLARCAEHSNQVMPESNASMQDSPFPGLTPYYEEHTPVFRGRDQELEMAIRTIRERSEIGGIVTLIGDSGIGKTSFLQAALLPRLKAGGVAGSREWDYAPMLRLVSEPFRDLCSVLSSTLGISDSEIEATLSREGMHALPLGKRHIVLPIDQIEELQTRVAEDRAARFVQLLQEARAMSPCPVTVVCALRSDFFPEFLRSTRLAALVQDTVIPIGSVGPEAIRQIIIEPVRRQGKDITGSVVDKLIEYYGDGSSIPLLQTTLVALWSQSLALGDIKEITEDHLRLIGGVEGPLWKALEYSSSQIPRRNRRSVNKVLKKMVAPSGARIEVEWDKIPKSCQLDITNLVDNRILVASEGSAGRRVITFAHDILAADWQRVRKTLLSAEDRQT